MRTGKPGPATRAGEPAAIAVLGIADESTKALAETYVRIFGLEREKLWITTDRAQFQHKIGRRLDAGIGGAYVYARSMRTHLILINLERIDRAKPRSLELVVAEEFMHMRDWIDGDRRRHAKHGYDRIAVRVAELTGATMEEVRSCLLPRTTRPARYLYRCPGCRRTIHRKRRGTWSCGACSPTFDRRFVFVLECDLQAGRDLAEI